MYKSIRELLSYVKSGKCNMLCIEFGTFLCFIYWSFNISNGFVPFPPIFTLITFSILTPLNLLMLVLHISGRIKKNDR